MKNDRKLILACAALAVLMLLFAGVYGLTRPETTAGEKNITVEVVHKDGAARTFTYQTDLEYLGELLLSEGLIQGGEGPYGLYITTVDGEDAIFEEDQSYWAFYQEGEYASQGIDQTPIVDGDHFSLVYTVG